MTAAQAQILVAKLAAAFPRDWSYAGAATNAIYVDRIGALKSYPAAEEAIDWLIDHEQRLPAIGVVRETYQRYIDRHQPRQLEELDLTPEKIRENKARIAALMASVTKPIPPPEEEPPNDG